MQLGHIRPELSHGEGRVLKGGTEQEVYRYSGVADQKLTLDLTSWTFYLFPETVVASWYHITDSRIYFYHYHWKSIHSLLFLEFILTRNVVRLYSQSALWQLLIGRPRLDRVDIKIICLLLSPLYLLEEAFSSEVLQLSRIFCRQKNSSNVLSFS